MEDRILKTQELAKFLGVSRVTVWKMEKEGKLPPKMEITERNSGWLYSDILEWLKQNVKETEPVQ